MNKYSICPPIPVIEAADKSLLLSLRQVNSKMRERVFKEIKKSKVTLNSYSDKALALSERLFIGTGYIPVPDKPSKGIVNYKVINQSDLNKLRSPLDCCLILEEEIEPTVFKRVSYLAVNSVNISYYSKSTFEYVDTLVIEDTSPSKIAALLNSIKRIHTLKFSNVTLNSEIQTESTKIEVLYINNSTIEESVSFPAVKTLTAVFSSGIHYLSCPQLETLFVNKVVLLDMFYAWVKTLPRLKEIDTFFSNTPQLLNYLGKSIRSITHKFQLDSSQIDFNCRFPYLIKFDAPRCEISFSAVAKTKLKYLFCKVTEIKKDKLPLRFKNAQIWEIMREFYSKHPETLEFCRKFTILDPDFEFSLLPSNIQTLQLYSFKLSCKDLSSV